MTERFILYGERSHGHSYYSHPGVDRPMFDFGLARGGGGLGYTINNCGTWVDFRCGCEAYLDTTLQEIELEGRTRTIEVYVVYVRTEPCEVGHQVERRGG